MWIRVDSVLTDVSGERTFSIFRVEEKEETPQARNRSEQVLTYQVYVSLSSPVRRSESWHKDS
jgi:hypothetical protein